MKQKFTILAIYLFLPFWLMAQEHTINIIPKPHSITMGSGVFNIDRDVIIYHTEGLEFETDLLASLMRLKSRVITKNEQPKGRFILLTIDSSLKKQLGNEGYTLKIKSDNVQLVAASNSGVLYGVQSLRQMLPAELERKKIDRNIKLSLPAVEISDKPKFSWRGYMKDVSRTFYSVDVIKKYLDIMSLYKINIFHWHLTDDQGWRIEIKGYPELTSEITTTFHHSENQPKERSGYYTQEDIKEVVQYAKQRGITIVPEIDVPGHSWPTLLVYPNLAVNKNFSPAYIFPFLASWGHWGVQFTQNTLDPTNEEVYTFLDGVFEEIAALFPGEYIHFGGDEVMHHLWEREPHVKEYMAKHNMQGFADLQNYFVTRVSDIIESKGKKPIGWNDILAAPDDLPRKSVIMCWLGSNAVKQAASNRFYSVATPTYPMYFDIAQNERNDGTMADLNYGHINDIKSVYLYNPLEGLSNQEASYLLGVQANMWSAVAQEVKDMNVQNFPRLIALSEAGWTEPATRNFEAFKSRLQSTYKRLDELKVDYYRDGGYITNLWTPQMISENYTPIEYNVTNKVYANGRVVVGFFFTKGANFLEIESVELLENGKIISKDAHYGLADKQRGITKPRSYFYNLKIDKYNKRAKYTIRATVRGHKGVDSYGNFTFNLSPYTPFERVEKP